MDFTVRPARAQDADALTTENLEFGRRAFPDARVERVTVRTSAPIPVYEDLVGE